ncbi:MAG: hypothetical protein GC165_02660 [Armatimonadetes bacterium]|nr:hypothetical protein [Armatimonadota bacterium]
MPRIGTGIFVACLTVAMTGCRKQTPVTFTQWASNDRSTELENAAFTHLIAAGNAVDKQAQIDAGTDSKGRQSTPLTERTTFYPLQKTQALKLIGNWRKAALQAATEMTTFNYKPTGLDNPPRYLAGLRLIGMSMLWDAEDGARSQDYDKAITACGDATRLGFALMGGGAYEASLGASLINQARLDIVKHMGDLSAKQLGNLGAAIQKASANRPPMQVSVENEKDNMLLSLQQAQDLFQAKKLDELLAKMGSSAKDQIDQLDNLEDEPEKAKDLFDWIGRDISVRTEWYMKKVRNPRKVGLPPKLEDRRQFRMMYRYFGTNIENLVPLLQTTYCRTQLLVLECYLMQKQKLRKELPKSLKSFSRSAVLDPFTGEPFYYKAGDTSYLLYSAGEDGIDNGGATDSNFRSPDLLLEKGQP